MKNIERKDDHPVFGKVHFHPHSELGKLPVIEVSIAYQISRGKIRLIKFVATKLTNSFKLPFFEESLKIIFLDKK